MRILILLLLPALSFGQYFNVDYAAGWNNRNNKHDYNDFSISWGKIWKGGLGLGTGMGIAGARSPIFAEATYRPNRKKDEMYYNVRMGVDYKIKFYYQFRLGYQMNINQSSIPVFIHITQRYNKHWSPVNPQRNEHLYGIGIGWRISERY